MKLCLLFALAFAIVAAASSAEKAASHSISWGTRGLRDSHLKREVVFSESRLWRKTTSDYVFDQKDIPYPKIITQVVVTDQYTNGKGGFATLTSGGPHMAFVKLRFTSQRCHGFNFIVDIYGQ